MVRIAEDARKCVVFLGHHAGVSDGTSEFIPAGTAFFLVHDGISHIITARHVAEGLRGATFDIRANLMAGGVGVVTVDEMKWYFHKDKNVDVAVLPAGLHMDYDWVVLPSDLHWTKEQVEKGAIGGGDEINIVGLYRLLPGKDRILPIVHTGHLALLPGDEPIPIKGSGGKTAFVEGYLVEAQTLQGLSGSPVIARKTWRMEGASGPAFFSGPGHLLGLYQGAWDGPAGEILQQDRNSPLRIPVGMGIVVPAYRIIETLEQDEVKRHREDLKKKKPPATDVAASMDSVPPATDENPSHQEDFTSLVSAAARKRPQGGQT